MANRRKSFLQRALIISFLCFETKKKGFSEFLMHCALFDGFKTSHSEFVRKETPPRLLQYRVLTKKTLRARPEL